MERVIIEVRYMKTDKVNFLKNMKRTWVYIKECKGALWGYATVSIIEGILGAILPLFAAKIILNITSGMIYQLVLSALSVFGIELIICFLFLMKGHLFQTIHKKTQTGLQIAVARETLNLEIAEIDKATSGLFIDRLNKDTGEISAMFMEYTYWISYVISHIGVLISIVLLNHYLFWFCLFSSLLIFVTNKIRLSKQYEIQKHVKQLQEQKTGLTGELVRGIRDIKVLNAANAILNETSKKIMETANEEVRMLHIRTNYQYLERNMRMLSDFLFILFGCYLLQQQLLTIPVFVIIYNYQGKVQNLLTGIVQLLEYNKKFAVSATRVFEVIGNDTFQKEKFGEIHFKRLTGHIRFEQVCFGYEKGKPILNQMTFEIMPNETVAFVGKSGAGKTTIFHLITRLYHSNSGSILLDGTEIEQLDCASIRDNMSIITQNSYLFNFSIKENLLLAKPSATMAEIREACKMACIDDFIMSLKEQYDTLIGENGTILSGGQRQRIAIARALLMKTEIILLDEATSALDNETQSEIQTAIQNMQGEYTILIIAHRLSTVINSDKIFVVENGQIIATGSHQELLKECAYYKQLYEKDLQQSNV